MNYNFLFIGQSLHNYVSLMIEKGYKSEFVTDYLASQGVDRELVKMVVDRVNSSVKWVFYDLSLLYFSQKTAKYLKERGL